MFIARVLARLRGDQAISGLLTQVDQLLAAGETDAAGRLFSRMSADQLKAPDAVRRRIQLSVARGDLGAAAEMLQRLLEAAPTDHEAWRNLGRVLVAKNEVAAAATAFERAVEHNPQQPELWLEWTDALRAAGQLGAAATACDQAVKHLPAAAELWRRSAELSFANADFAAAARGFSRAAALVPDDACTTVNWALSTARSGDSTEARRVLALLPRSAPAADVLRAAKLWLELGAPELARLLVDQAAVGSDAGSWFELGRLRAAFGDLVAARAAYERAIEIDPQHAASYVELAELELKCGRLDEARDWIETGRATWPESEALVLLWCRLQLERGGSDAPQDTLMQIAAAHDRSAAIQRHVGAIAYRKGDYGGAAELFRRAIELLPGDADSHNNLGNCLLQLGQVEAGLAELEAALAILPNDPGFRANYGQAYVASGDPWRAAVLLEAVLQDFPADPTANWAMAVACLSAGDFDRGWRYYEWRWHQLSAAPRKTVYPAWDGTSKLAGRLLIRCEQGLGDQIMFSACLPAVLRRCEQIVFACNPRLVKLFRRSFPDIEVRAEGADADSAEGVVTELALGSLPAVVPNAPRCFADQGAYLRADPQRSAYWRGRLADLGAGRKIGISWEGGTAQTRALLRRIPLQEWGPILRCPGSHFVSLQYTKCDAELAALDSDLRVTHWQSAIDDYDETAALVENLDLVISVCTSLVHLAGALGRPTWVFVPQFAEWRYWRGGPRLPWYPATHLLWQTQTGRWGDVIDRVAQTLAQSRSEVE